MVIEPEDETVGSREDARPGRYARLRLSVGRHPADLARAVVAAAVVAWCWYVARAPEINPVESAILQDIQQLPGWSRPFWQVVTLVGWWPGVLVVGAVFLYLGHMRLGISAVVAGVAGGAVALLLQSLTPLRELTGVTALPVESAPAVFDFPSVHVAVAAALVTASGPYLLRPARHLGWTLVVLVAAAEVFLGGHLPLGVFAGGFIGWGVGALAHAVIGAPGRTTTEAAVHHVLARAGLQVEEVTRIPGRMWRPQEFAITTSCRGRLSMTVVRRMHRRAGSAYKMRRFIASLEVADEPDLSTPRHEVDHEAYLTLLAERAGVHTLPIVLAGELHHGPSFLLRRWVDGRPLSDLSAAEVDEQLLDEVWECVCTLATASIVHHDLRAKNFFVDLEGHPRLASFTFGRVGGGTTQKAQDLADTLVSLTSVVGVERALASAERALSREQLESMLPSLQSLALHRRVRGQLDEQSALADLRETLADRLETAVPSFRSPIRPATVAMLLAGGLAVYLLLPELSSMQEVLGSLERANGWWIAATIVAGLGSIVASAWTIFGATSTHLPLWRTIAVQVAAAFTGRTTVGGVGFFGINIVFLEKLGLRRTNAVGVVLLSRIGHGLVSAAGTIAGLVAIGRVVPVGEVHAPTGVTTWLVVTLVVCAIAAVVASPFGRARIVRPLTKMVRDILRDLIPMCREPGRAAGMFGGSIVSLGLLAIGLYTTLEAFAPGAPVLAVMAVFIVASTLGQMAPTPGGLGTVEAAMVAGLTAIGVGSTDAVAAVLASRLLTFWLPIVPGVVVFRVLQHRQIV